MMGTTSHMNITIAVKLLLVFTFSLLLVTGRPVGDLGLCSTFCTTAQCLSASCSINRPFLCTSPTTAHATCSASPWPFSNDCTSCCDYASCFIGCDSMCTADQCGSFDSKDYPASVTMCTTGAAVGAISEVSDWSPMEGCIECCNASSCSSYTNTPGLWTNPPILTPVPGWTMSPTDFPAPTPLPVVPPATPIPSGQCLPCSKTTCEATNGVPVCVLNAPFLCLSGAASGACMDQPWETSACLDCCDYNVCLPPPPAPFPASPWDLVPRTPNCSNYDPESLFLAPNPGATPYGAMDVTDLGCRADVSEACCGVTPRYNWALAFCNSDPAQRRSQACNHTYGNTSAAEIYYIRAYQFNAEVNGWVVDPSSSFSASSPGSVINFDALNLSLLSGPSDRQDWDLKYGPTTAKQGTDGLGPPGMLFLLSARKLSWMTFYALNQITLNRGPGGENYEDNCWSSSAGEFDFLEAPFWGGVHLPQDRLYASITSGTGRCFPVQKMVSRAFQRECSHPDCCQMCDCPKGMVCAGDPHHVGFAHVSCYLPNVTVPSEFTVYTVDGNPTACGDYFAAVPGGSQSTSFFSNDTHAPLQKGNESSEVIIAAVVDGDGVTVYRWPSSQISVWSGVGKYNADDTLPLTPSRPISPRPPCVDANKPCAVYLPSCDDECALISASGNFGSTQLAGAFAAESARDNLNWWSYYASTGQIPSSSTPSAQPPLMSNQLPMFVEIPVTPASLPFTCNATCPEAICQLPGRCTSAVPFVCLSGSNFHQCSSFPDVWPLSGLCTSCCDARSCEVPCAAECSPEACAATSCDAQTQPFYCEAGPLAGTCNAEVNYFPQVATCYSCCNSLSCVQ